MKKAYEAPQITNYGRVQDVTNAFGDDGSADTFQVGNNPTQFPGEILGLSGSAANGIIIPVGSNRGR
ncbi:lasso peptide [Nostoc sp. PCC 7107]|uniref:lasso peptide n=1 Tax=Nostoc sp. PCC 7107 TaxID=317936 RepID=UPI00029F4DC4|nr:lasso peptide [Nostoc sp. PCC 7107]AFY45038.1 rhizobiocin/RTX toxin and hemolysin-type calcium binding protein [Nostoc sp. PCC 7107]